MKLELVYPKKEMKKEIEEFREEFYRNNEMHIPGCAKMDMLDTIGEWICYIEKLEKGISKDGYVKSTVLFGVVNKKIVGIIDLRHELNNWMIKNGCGNIGYAVRPSERKKGYASLMLKQGLKFYKNKNIDYVEVSCDRDNIGSKKTIIKNKGIFDRLITDSEISDNVEVYKIKIGSE